MNPTQLVFVSLFVLLSGCGESVDVKKPPKGSKHAVEYSKSAGSLSPAISAGFVAGLAPNQRPTGAPVIREFAPSADWRAQSLTGVSEPIPASIGNFIDSQGAWYTPFNQPGMPGYYDLRNWHHGSNNAGQ